MAMEVQSPKSGRSSTQLATRCLLSLAAPTAAAGVPELQGVFIKQGVAAVGAVIVLQQQQGLLPGRGVFDLGHYQMDAH